MDECAYPRQDRRSCVLTAALRLALPNRRLRSSMKAQVARLKSLPDGRALLGGVESKKRNSGRGFQRTEELRIARLRQTKSTISCKVDPRVAATQAARRKPRGGQMVKAQPRAWNDAISDNIKPSQAERRLAGSDGLPVSRHREAIQQARVQARAQAQEAEKAQLRQHSKKLALAKARRLAQEPPAQNAERRRQRTAADEADGVHAHDDGQFIMRFGCEDPHGDQEKSPTPEYDSGPGSRGSRSSSRGSRGSRASNVSSGCSHVATMKHLQKAGAHVSSAQRRQRQRWQQQEQEEEEQQQQGSTGGAQLQCEPGQVGDAHIFGAGETPELRKHLGINEAADSVALGSIDPQSALSLFDQPPSHKAAKVAPKTKAAVATTVAAAAPPAKPACASKIPAPKARAGAAPSKGGSGTAAAPVASAGPKLATANAITATFKPKNGKPKQQLQVRCSLEKLQAEHAEALAFLQELETGAPSLGGGDVVEAAPGGGGGGLTARSDRSDRSASSMAEAALEAAKVVLAAPDGAADDEVEASDDEVEWAPAPLSHSSPVDAPAPAGDPPLPTPQLNSASPPCSPNFVAGQTADTFYGCAEMTAAAAFSIKPLLNEACGEPADIMAAAAEAEASD